MVIERILRENEIHGEQLLSFGDGYVEIENTKEVGGLAVAVASDEANNGSGRMDEWKRERLSGVGADVVIPDFRDAGPSSGTDPGTMNTTPLDLTRLRVRPLAERDSLTRVDEILIDPDAAPAALSGRLSPRRSTAAPRKIRDGPGQGGRRDPDLRRPPAAQRRGADPRRG